jgi:hypothetical protein
MQINVFKVQKVKINNLKIARDLKTIGEKKFKTKVKDILNM